jgi:hypothetical protein
MHGGLVYFAHAADLAALGVEPRVQLGTRVKPEHGNELCLGGIPTYT